MGYNWKKLKNAEVFGRGQYLKAGFHYKAKVLKMFTIKTRKKGSALIVDLEIMESTCPEIPVGQVRNWFQSLQDEDVAFPSIKDFLLQLFDVDQADEEELEEFNENLGDLMEECADDKWEKMDSSEHPLNGKFIQVDTWEKETNNGKPFTVHDWAPWDGVVVPF